jgi:hypothetical protein
MSSSSFNSGVPYLNGSGYGAQRDGGFDLAREAGDDSLDRIRELLFGDLRRSWDARLQTLETRLQMLEDKLDAVRHQHDADHREHLDALAAGIDDLGNHVRRLTRGR